MQVAHERAEARLALLPGPFGQQTGVLAQRQDLTRHDTDGQQHGPDNQRHQRRLPGLDRHKQQERIATCNARVRNGAERWRHRLPRWGGLAPRWLAHAGGSRLAPALLRRNGKQPACHDPEHVWQHAVLVTALGDEPRKHDVADNVDEDAQRQNPQCSIAGNGLTLEQDDRQPGQDRQVAEGEGDGQERAPGANGSIASARPGHQRPENHRARNDDHRGVQDQLAPILPGARYGGEARQRQQHQRIEGSEGGIGQHGQRRFAEDVVQDGVQAAAEPVHQQRQPEQRPGPAGPRLEGRQGSGPAGEQHARTGDWQEGQQGEDVASLTRLALTSASEHPASVEERDAAQEGRHDAAGLPAQTAPISLH